MMFLVMVVSVMILTRKYGMNWSEFDLDNIEDWGSNLEEAVRNILAIRMYIEPNDTTREIWGEMADRIGGC